MAKEIRSRKGLETLLQRYKDAGVTNQTKDVTGGYEARWLDTIQGCIDSIKTDEPIKAARHSIHMNGKHCIFKWI